MGIFLVDPRFMLMGVPSPKQGQTLLILSNSFLFMYPHKPHSKSWRYQCVTKAIYHLSLSLHNTSILSHTYPTVCLFFASS